MIVDNLAKKFSLRFSHKLSYHIACKDNEMVLIKPMLYMNNAGTAVREYLEPSGHNQSFIVVYDDLALPLGKIRIREQGSDGGHNGLASIIYHLQTKNFPRLRIGIGKPASDVTATDYVLTKFAKEEQPVLEKIIEVAGESLITAKDFGIKKAMNIYNAWSLEIVKSD